MKGLLFLIPIIVLGLLIWGDIALAQHLFTFIPTSEWAGLLRVGVTAVLFFATAGFILAVTLFITSIVTAVVTH